MSLPIPPLTLALPYNHDPRYPAWIDANPERIDEVYLPIHGSVAATARPWLGPEDEGAYLDELRPLAEVLRRHGITANVVVNLPVWTASRTEIPAAIARMREIFDRVEVTIGDYPLARDLRLAFPDLALGVSCSAEVDSVRKARPWVDTVGVRSIVISREINKRPDAIRPLRQLGARLKIVLDDACLPGCPAMTAHTALMMAKDSPWCGSHRCFVDDDRIARPWLVAQKDVVPATLPRYAGLVDVGKVEGRTESLDVLERKRRAYLEATSWAHPYGHYVEPPEAFDRIVRCDRDCERCGWCAAAFEERR